jgi:Flp pilus assembly secretin CpaC
MVLRSWRDAPCLTSRLAVALIAISIGAVVACPARAEDQISVVVDQAKLVKMPDRVTTLVIGNPMIADVSLQPGGMMVVTGKGYGSTNIIAMDRTGNVLSDRQIQVEGGGEKLVTVFRGTDRQTYTCTPKCERRVTLGDESDYFKSGIEQSDSLNAEAAGVQADTAKPK